jgi:hypothetical protein
MEYGNQLTAHGEHFIFELMKMSVKALARRLTLKGNDRRQTSKYSVTLYGL